MNEVFNRPMQGVAQQQKRDIRTYIQSDAVRHQLALVLPKHITPDRMARVALTAILRTPKLMQCSQESLLQALMLCSQVGLEPDGRNAHLIPYGDKVQVIFDYKGLVTLARRNGVKGIHADVVCEADQFDVSFNGGPQLTHRINYQAPRGTVYAAYCYFILDGEPDLEVMQLDEIEAIRKRSQAGDRGPWVSDWAEMAKKTVIRRASKKWPLDPEMADAMMADYDAPQTIKQSKPANTPIIFSKVVEPETSVVFPIDNDIPQDFKPVPKEESKPEPQPAEKPVDKPAAELLKVWNSITEKIPSASFDDLLEFGKVKDPLIEWDTIERLDSIPPKAASLLAGSAKGLAVWVRSRVADRARGNS